jgi:hypothetical protein
MLWTIWIQRNDLTFNNNIWDSKRTQRMIWQGILEYARIVRYIAREDANKESNYDDTIGKIN